MSEGSRSVSVADDSAVAADRSGSLWLRLGQAWRGVTLAVAFVLGFAPLVPRYPSVGFDASWISAVRDAGSRDLAWGTDFIYTAGPLGDLYTGAWSPELSWLIPGIGIAYCLIAAALAYELLRSHPWWTTPLAALLVTSGLVGRDAIYLLPPFLLATLVASEAPVDDPPAPTRRLVWLAIAAAPAGLLPLVKLSGVPVAVLSVAYCFLVLARRGEWSRAVVVLVAPFVTLVVAWLAVGQPLSSLWDWARTAVMVVGGYSQALAQAGPFVYVVVFVTSGAAITLIVLARLGSERGRLERIAFAALTAATCFLAFKSGFVRQDAHVLLAASSLLAVVAVVVCRLPRLAACAVGAVGVVTWFVMAHAAAVSTPQIVGDALQRAWLDAPRAAADRLFRSDRLEARYEAAEAAIRRDPRMPQVAPGGSYDLYTSELSFLFAQGVDWSPRPAVQSRTAYTPGLAELDRAHLESGDRPDHLLVRFDLRDGIWAPLGDGASWLSMARWYDYGGEAGQYIRLDARHEPRSIEYGPAHTETGQLGNDLAMETPHGWDGLVATIQLDPTWRGRLVSTVLRSSNVRITERLDDGSSFTKRFLPQLGSVEVVVSPHLNSASALATLIDPTGVSHALRRTEAIRLTADTPADWARTAVLTYRPFRIAR